MYKINYVINNKISKIYVFYGKSYSVTSSKKLPIKEALTDKEMNPEKVADSINYRFKKNPLHSEFKNIFEKSELDNIVENNIDVYFSEQRIHPDDTIAIIKLKILIYTMTS